MARIRVAAILVLAGMLLGASPGVAVEVPPLLPVEVKRASFDGSETFNVTLKRYSVTWTYTGNTRWHIVWDTEHPNGELHPDSWFKYSGTVTSSSEGELCSVTDVEWTPASLFLDATYISRGRYKFTVVRPTRITPWDGAGCGSSPNPVAHPLPDILPARRVNVSSGYATVPQAMSDAGTRTVEDTTYAWNVSLQGTVTFGRPACPAGAGATSGDDNCAVAVTQVRIEKDVPIRERKDATIFRRKFNDDCVLKDVDPAVNDRPIADAARTGSFTLRVSLGACPRKPAKAPRVEWTARAGKATRKGSFTGWGGAVTAPTPERVGEYSLNVDFAIKLGGRTLPQRLSRRLLVVHDEPAPDMMPPKLRWIEVAVEWAEGARTPAEVAESLNRQEYRKGRSEFKWEYGYRSPGVCDRDWEALIDETPGDRTECSIFALVWRNLARVHGLPAQTRSWSNKIGVMLKPGLVALDNTGMNAGAHPKAKPDRWLFATHTVGFYKGKHYDPTFGTEYASLTANWLAVGVEKTVTDEDGKWQWYRLADGSGCIKDRRTGPRNERGWQLHVYKPQKLPSALCAAPHH